MVELLRALLPEFKSAALGAIAAVVLWVIYGQTGANQWALFFASAVTGYVICYMWETLTFMVARHQPYPRGYHAYIFSMMVLILFSLLLTSFLGIRTASFGAAGFTVILWVVAMRLGELDGRRGRLERSQEERKTFGTSRYDLLLRNADGRLDE